MELQSLLIDNNKQLTTTRMRLQVAEKERRKNELTLQELESLPDGANTYTAIGKMYYTFPDSALWIDWKNSHTEYSILPTGFFGRRCQSRRTPLRSQSKITKRKQPNSR